MGYIKDIYGFNTVSVPLHTLVTYRATEVIPPGGATSSAKRGNYIYPVYNCANMADLEYSNSFKYNKPSFLYMLPSSQVPVAVYLVEDKFNVINRNTMILELSHIDVYPEYLKIYMQCESNHVDFSNKSDVLNLLVDIPVNEAGKFDEEAQKEIVHKYTKMESKLLELSNKITKLEGMANIYLEYVLTQHKVVDVELQELYTFQKFPDKRTRSAVRKQTVPKYNEKLTTTERTTRRAFSSGVYTIPTKYYPNGYNTLYTFDHDFCVSAGRVAIYDKGYGIEPYYVQKVLLPLFPELDNSITEEGRMYKLAHVTIPVPLIDGQIDKNQVRQICTVFEQMDSVLHTFKALQSKLVKNIPQLKPKSERVESLEKESAKKYIPTSGDFDNYKIAELFTIKEGKDYPMKKCKSGHYLFTPESTESNALVKKATVTSPSILVWGAGEYKGETKLLNRKCAISQGLFALEPLNCVSNKLCFIYVSKVIAKYLEGVNEISQKTLAELEIPIPTVNGLLSIDLQAEQVDSGALD